MLRALTVLLLLAPSLAFRVSLQGSKPLLLIESSSDLLRFDNFSGPGVHPKQITQFTAFVKEASALFPANVSAHTSYVKENMDGEFGSATENYFVMVQTGRTSSSYYVWITDKRVYASLSGINPAQPDWSYLFVRINAPRAGPAYVFVEQGQIGIGITPAIDDFINRTVDRYDPSRSGPCECQQDVIENIGTALNSGLKQAWSSMCGREGVTHALVHAVDGLWVSKARHNCEFTFYVHQL